MPSVVQDWINSLPFKLQTTLLCALRGCDGIAREDDIKIIARGIRKMTVLPSRKRLTEKGGFLYFELEELAPCVEKICEDLGKYPTHYIHHLILACEVIGYFHPIADIRKGFEAAYKALVKELNLWPESKEQCMERGNAK